MGYGCIRFNEVFLLSKNLKVKLACSYILPIFPVHLFLSLPTRDSLNTTYFVLMIIQLITLRLYTTWSLLESSLDS